MIAAMLLLPAVDAMAKWLAASHSPWFLIWVRYTASCLFVLPVAMRFHGQRIFPDSDLGKHGLRACFLVIAMLLYFLAIARIPLSLAVAAYFVGPIVAVLLATVVLGERLTAAKAASLAFGFIGTLLVLHPLGEIDFGVIFALGSGIFFGAYLVATRTAARSSPAVRTLAFQCVCGAVLLTPQAVFNWSAPDLSALLLFAAMGLVSAVSHFLAISAFRHAEATLLAPLVYVELLSAIGLGMLLFGERPGPTVIVGSAMIVLAGLLLSKVGRSQSVSA